MSGDETPEFEALDGGVRQAAGGGQLAAIGERVDRAFAYAVKSQTHLWVATTAYLVSDHALDHLESEPLQLDLENLAMAPALGCYVCEQPYSRRLRTRRCTGEPTS